jgi:4-amino-4-deoxy-L-arabinose transferase-like glycosyltransferase
MSYFNLTFFIIAAALSIWTINRMLINGDKLTVRPLPKNLLGLFVLLLVFLLLFMRTYRFGSVPGGMNQDGASAAVDAKALADYGTDHFGMVWPTHLTAWGYAQMSSLLSYIMAVFIKLFGMSVLTARLPLLIISLLGLLTLYLLCSEAWGKRAGLIVLAFGAVNPWHIMQSRWALEANLYPHFFLFGVYFLHKALHSKYRKTFIGISMIMFGLCMYCYGVSIYTMPLFLVLACIYLLAAKKVKPGEALLALLVWLLVAWPFILTMAVNYFKWDTIELPFMTIPYFKDSVRSNDILFFSGNFGAQLKANLASLWNILKQGNDLPWNVISGFGTMYLFSAPFVVVGLVFAVKERKNPASVLVLLFLLTGLWCGICTNGVNVNRINIIFYPLIILAGLGIWNVIERAGLPRLELGFIALYLVALCLFGNTYFGSYADSMEYYFMDDFGQAVTAVKDTDAEKIYITSRSQSENSTNVSEILTLFYQDVDAEYFQGKRQISGQLPYNQRYTYVNMANLEIDGSENAVYVVNYAELQYFQTDDYNIQQYGSYYVLRSK